jgi:transposase
VVATKKRRRFDREDKLEAVRLALGSGKPQIEVGRDLGINAETLYRWVHEFRTDPEQSFPGNGQLKARDQEVEQLCRQVSRPQAENAFLKNVSAYFVKSPR